MYTVIVEDYWTHPSDLLLCQLCRLILVQKQIVHVSLGQQLGDSDTHGAWVAKMISCAKTKGTTQPFNCCVDKMSGGHSSLTKAQREILTEAMLKI